MSHRNRLSNPALSRTVFSHIAASLVLVACASACYAAPVAAESAPANPAPAAPERPISATELLAHRAFHETMLGIRLPKKGCFKATYQHAEWQEVACVAAPKYPQMRVGAGKNGARPQNVGNGFTYGDDVAGTSARFSKVVGSFINGTPVSTMTETGIDPNTGISGANIFSLQLNTNDFNTAVCSGGAAGCQGWQQYVLDNDSGSGYGLVYIQYWLIGYGPTCPPAAGWLQTPLAPNDCYQSTTANGVGVQTMADMNSLILTATAPSGGTDQLTLSTPSGDVYATGQDSFLQLAANWQFAEFNVFGDGNGTEATFGPGTIVVEAQTTDGTNNAPSCPGNQSFTGETNSLDLVNPCCAYPGTTPRIEFMETNQGHTAVCGATQLVGDPHITTVDGKRYNFQGAGEFVSLRDTDGTEIQTRQEPVATATTLNDPTEDDGLATCVSLNTAFAAKVGSHRVTYQSNTGPFQLRVDGAVKTLGASGINLGSGARVVNASAGSGIEVQFPDGKVLTANPGTYMGKGYIDVLIGNVGLVSDAVDSSMGGLAAHFANDSWLPALPNGASMGAMPASLHDRYVALYDKFGDAWRVPQSASLFDYAPGTSTATFTDTSWPKENPPCNVPNMKAVQPISKDAAEQACRLVTNDTLHSNCVFDVTVTGNVDLAKTYKVTETLRLKLIPIRLPVDR